jgi:hypothetical protein
MESKGKMPLKTGERLKNGMSPKSRTSRRNLMAVAVFAVLAGLCMMSSCHREDNDENATDTDIPGKYEVTDTDSPYASFEFTEDGKYMIVERNPTKAASSTKASPAGTMKYGTYVTNGNTIDLLGFGIIIVSENGNSKIFSVELVSEPGQSKQYAVRKMPSAIESEQRANMLCRTWRLVEIMGLPVTPGSSSEFTLTFSKAGTYFVVNHNGSTELHNWRWYDEQKTIIEHYDDAPGSGAGIANIDKLTDSELELSDLGVIPMKFVAGDFLSPADAAEKNVIKCTYAGTDFSYDFYLAKTTPGAYDPDDFESQYYPYTIADFTIAEGESCNIVFKNILILKELDFSIKHDVQQGETCPIYTVTSGAAPDIEVAFWAGAGTGAFNLSQRKSASPEKAGEITITKKTADVLSGTFWCEMEVGALSNGEFTITKE